MIGPSAMGSENGKPSSMTSAPAASRPRSSSIVRSVSGNPAVMYGTSARRPTDLSSARRCSIGFNCGRDCRAVLVSSDEVLANADGITVGDSWSLTITRGSGFTACTMPSSKGSSTAGYPSGRSARREIEPRSRFQDVHFTYLRHVFVAAPAHAQQHRLVARPASALGRDPAYRVRGLQRGNDAFQLTQE